jgi:hypothetical protein
MEAVGIYIYIYARGLLRVKSCQQHICVQGLFVQLKNARCERFLNQIYLWKVFSLRGFLRAKTTIEYYVTSIQCSMW